MNKRAGSPSYKQQPMLTANCTRMRNRYVRQVRRTRQEDRALPAACREGARSMTEGVDKIIEEMEAQKTAFHPEQQK
jgi:hypothetical protein